MRSRCTSYAPSARAARTARAASFGAVAIVGGASGGGSKDFTRCLVLIPKRLPIRSAKAGEDGGRYPDARLTSSEVVIAAPGKADPVPSTPSCVCSTIESALTARLSADRIRGRSVLRQFDRMFQRAHIRIR